MYPELGIILLQILHRGGENMTTCTFDPELECAKCLNESQQLKYEVCHVCTLHLILKELARLRVTGIQP